MELSNKDIITSGAVGAVVILGGAGLFVAARSCSAENPANTAQGAIPAHTSEVPTGRTTTPPGEDYSVIVPSTTVDTEPAAPPNNSNQLPGDAAASQPTQPSAGEWSVPAVPPTTAQPAQPPANVPPPPQPRTYPERQQYGADVFRDYLHVSGITGRLGVGIIVQVECVAYSPTVVAVSVGHYWYRYSGPSGEKLYVAANTFENGNPVGGPEVDQNVPLCPKDS